MIRHVQISAEDEVRAETACFAWFDTITDSFLTYSGEQVWTTWAEFEAAWRDDEGDEGKYDLDRFRGLFPSEGKPCG